MKMEYTPIPLATVFDVDAIVNISYYKLENGYVFSGESHVFWEFSYVDRGSIVVTAGADKYFLKAGELAFHCPYEFHSFQSVGASDVMVVAFCCESEAMHRLEKKVLLLHQREKQCLKPLMDEAQQAYQYFENDPALVNLRKKPTAPWGSDQIVKLYLEQLLIWICRRDDNLRFSQRAVTSTQFHQHLLLAQTARDYLAAHYAEAITLSSLAAALGAEICRIYTDVDGVYDRDPRKCPNARRLRHVDYDRMLSMARGGAQVLHDRCVELARDNHIRLEVRSTFTDAPGTIVG